MSTPASLPAKRRSSFYSKAKDNGCAGHSQSVTPKRGTSASQVEVGVGFRSQHQALTSVESRNGVSNRSALASDGGSKCSTSPASGTTSNASMFTSML